jgi:hypothetical protein
MPKNVPLFMSRPLRNVLTRLGGFIELIRIIAVSCRHAVEDRQIDVTREGLYAAVAHEELRDARVRAAKAAVAVLLLRILRNAQRPRWVHTPLTKRFFLAEWRRGPIVVRVKRGSRFRCAPTDFSSQ